ncbi:YrbL family protein [Roseivivax sp. CAU 1753]
MTAPDILSLATATRLARGSERAVYRMPGAADQLIKVMLPKYRRGFDGLDPDSRAGRRKHAEAYALFAREDAALRAARQRSETPPLAAIIGYRETDQGRGQVVEMIRGPDGGLAPSLAEQAATGALDDRQMQALATFVDAVYRCHIVVHDAGPANIVWDATAARYVLVDGFGDRSAVPLKSWFRALNDRRLDRAFAICGQKAGLRWDRATRRLSRP